jgi:hypothetical protein
MSGGAAREQLDLIADAIERYEVAYRDARAKGHPDLTPAAWEEHELAELQLAEVAESLKRALGDARARCVRRGDILYEIVWEGDAPSVTIRRLDLGRDSGQVLYIDR